MYTSTRSKNCAHYRWSVAEGRSITRRGACDDGERRSRPADRTSGQGVSQTDSISIRCGRKSLTSSAKGASVSSAAGVSKGVAARYICVAAARSGNSREQVCRGEEITWSTLVLRERGTLKGDARIRTLRRRQRGPNDLASPPTTPSRVPRTDLSRPETATQGQPMRRESCLRRVRTDVEALNLRAEGREVQRRRRRGRVRDGGSGAAELCVGGDAGVDEDEERAEDDEKREQGGARAGSNHGSSVRLGGGRKAED